MAKVLHVIQHLKMGGAQRMLINLLRGLQDFENVVLSTENALGSELRELNIPFIDFSSCNMLRAFRDQKPEIIHYIWWPGFKVPRKKMRFGQNPRVVVSIVDPSPVDDIGADMYVADSDYGLKQQSHITEGLRCMVPCYVDIESYNIARRKHAGVVIGRHSTIYPTKIPDYLIEFLLSLNIPDARFVIAGDGDEATRSELAARIGALGGTGRIELWPNSRIREMLSICDIYLYLTPSDSVESFANVLSEAMVAGIPVIAEAKGANEEQIVHGETGFLCTSLEEARVYCELLAGDHSLREDMGQRARERALTFDYRIMCQSYERLFMDLLR